MVRDGIVTEENPKHLHQGRGCPHHPDGENSARHYKKITTSAYPAYSGMGKGISGEMLHADEVMVTDTNSEIVPIIKITDQIIGSGKRGEITQDIQIAYKALIEERGKL
ncbi:MAG: hypothetical protein ACLT16_19240 [[Clostridium] innocuum]